MKQEEEEECAMFESGY